MLVGMHEFTLFGSLDLIFWATSLTPSAKSLPQSAITVKVKGIPTRAKRMQKILPQLVDGTMFPYPEKNLQLGAIIFLEKSTYLGN